VPVDNVLSDTNVAFSSWYSHYPRVLLTDIYLGWNLFAAAMTTNEDLRSLLISKVHSQASLNSSVGVFPVNYGSADGSAPQGLQGVAR
jgi:hypothetical protein